jgi:uncharacterized protein YjbI with pentapeptide repeats
MADEEQLKILRQGVAAWNDWREKNPEVQPNLRQANLREVDLGRANLRQADLWGANLQRASLHGADLSRANLREADLGRTNLGGANLIEADLSRANLIEADLGGANLQRASLHGADLGRANLRKVDLGETNLGGANLRDADLGGANLSRANLDGAQLIGTDLRDATLTGSNVYGASVWDVKVNERTEQQNVVITEYGAPVITVDNITVAQVIHLLLNNQEIRDVISAITSKAVLILGRFSEERKVVLDALREELRKHDYLPILFDFPPVANRGTLETIKTLASMARFVVADVTDARGVLMELGAIVPAFPSLAVRLMVKKSEDEYGMMDHISSYRSVVAETYAYEDVGEVVASIQENIIRPAEAKVRELRRLSEGNIAQLVAGGPEERRARSKTDWLREICDAVSTRNRDQLQAINGALEAESVTDQTVLRALLNAYFDLRDFVALINLFETFKEQIGEDPIVLFRYGWALVRTGQSSRAIMVLEQVRRRGVEEAELTGLLARAYKDQWRVESARGDVKTAEESLHHAVTTYTEGFRKYPSDYNLGLNAVELLHLLGDERSRSLRDELLPEVQLAIERAAAESGDDYWSSGSLLELAIIRESQADAQQLAARLRSKADSPWQIETTVQNLRLLSEAKGFRAGTPEWVHDLVSSLAA